MPLRLTITSYHKLTPGQCSEKVLDQGQLTIGRGPDNDWVLPDPERLVSSRHCTILNRDCWSMPGTACAAATASRCRTARPSASANTTSSSSSAMTSPCPAAAIRRPIRSPASTP